MRDVLTTLLFEHDLRFVALAALVCATASYAAITMLNHARQNSGTARTVWLAIAALATGVGIWSTHFIAMIAFDAGIPTGYDPLLTGLSLLIAVGVTGIGFTVAVLGTSKSDAILGGIITGLGISAMHYTGMASLVIGGAIEWQPVTVITSILLGASIGGFALYAGLRTATLKGRLAGAGALTLAICTMHFTAMGAAGFENCFGVVSPDNSVASVLMPVAVAGASLLILGAALVGVRLEIRDRLRAEQEFERLRGLANAAVEGLVVCEGDVIVTVNDSFRKMVGAGDRTLAGQRVTDFLDDKLYARLHAEPDTGIELELNALQGDNVPVEAILRHIDFGGKQQIALALRDLRASRRAEQYIRYLAHHDALTGLPNRTSFTEALEDEVKDAQRHHTRLAVLCMDLDRFKEINDLHGHASGDEALKIVGEVLSRTHYAGQVAARLSGDEFAILLPEITSDADASRVAANILEALAEQNGSEKVRGDIGASIGIAVFPDDALDAATLMNQADTALYRAKQEGRGRYCFFEQEMGTRVRDRRQLEHDLRHAIARDQLSMVYQPQVRIDGREVVGFEALLRWTHPERGAISPAVFIPLAEESGLILRIGEWVLRAACETAAAWKNPLTIAVNVSTVQLHSPKFPELVHEILHETGLSARRLELEVTETALVKDMARAVSALAQIKALGVRIAMDDFGTGYSSLSNLRAFDFDKIKVDQSFIKSVDSSEQSATIVRAVLGLGQGLNLPVLAEGVERIEELSFLQSELCAEAQGFFLGRPSPIADFDRFTNGNTKISDALEVDAGGVVPLKKRG